MKIAFAGKGGSGKTTIASWLGEYLAAQGKNVWLIDADTALSLGRANGLSPNEIPDPLIAKEQLIRERIGEGIMNLNPEVSDLPEKLSVALPQGKGEGLRRLLVMGTVAGAGGGCACHANSLLKALLAHMIYEREDWVLIDLEAGVEHLGRGTVQAVDGLVIVSEPSARSLDTAAQISALATDLGLTRQVLVMNRTEPDTDIGRTDVPDVRFYIPESPALKARMLADSDVTGLEDRNAIFEVIGGMVDALARD